MITSLRGVGQIQKEIWQSEGATAQRKGVAVHFSAASVTRVTGRSCSGEPGTGLRPWGRRRGQLTEVWLVGTALELDSSGARLYQEMPHELMGHVPWDEEKETWMRHCPQCPSATSQHYFQLLQCAGL